MNSARYVWIWLPGQQSPTLCGRLFWDGAQAQFAYVRSYTENRTAISVHPDWPLDEPPGHKHGPADDDALPPVFLDVAPGAWGEYAIRKLGGRSLNAFEYLIHPAADRIGAFEFSEDPRTSPLAETPMAEEQIDQLRAVISAIEKDEDLPKQLRLVWRHGTTVGGRWPKAGVIDNDGVYWLLKFGSRLHHKEHQPRIEALGLSLAKACGIAVPEFRLEQNDVQPMLWVRRFDRLNDGKRRHMLSVRSLMALSERDALDRASYPVVGAALRRMAQDPGDVAAWFDRMILNIVIGNTDDHALNHLFFWDGERLSLAPAFDVEPQIEEVLQHAMRIGPAGGQGTIDNALASVAEYGLTKGEAEDRIRRVVGCVQEAWRPLAAQCGVRAEQVRGLESAAILGKLTGASRYLPT
jgi:serine/threonine-protein kinase HipA